MSEYLFTTSPGNTRSFTTHSPERLFSGGEVAKPPIPRRLLEYQKALEAQTPGLNCLISQENVIIRRTSSIRATVGLEVVQERVDQINIGLRMPFEIFRGQDNYMLNGHHRAVAALLCGLEEYPAYVLTTDQETTFEQDHYLGPDSFRTQFMWRMKYPAFHSVEPWEKRVAAFDEKLRPFGAELAKTVGQVPAETLSPDLQAMLVRLLLRQDLSGTILEFTEHFGLNLTDLQLVCMLRDPSRCHDLNVRLQQIDRSSAKTCLQKKIESLLALSEAASFLAYARDAA